MLDTCLDILRHESNLTSKFLTVSAGTSLLPKMSAGKNERDILSIDAEKYIENHNNILFQGGYSRLTGH